MKSIFNLNFEDAITKAETLSAELNLNGHVLPAHPPFPQSGRVAINSTSGFDITVSPVSHGLTTQRSTIFATPMCFPLSIKNAGEKDANFWLLPVEPMISFNGSNTVIQRNVAKGSGKGSVYERWKTNDYKIIVEGLLTRVDDWIYPWEDVQKLRLILENGHISVLCDLMEYMGVSEMVIESFDLPFTKGEESQRYSFTGYSLEPFQLLISPLIYDNITNIVRQNENAV